MTPSRATFVVDFADCDPARIVFYPTYFIWFDRATERLFRERGMPWAELWPEYGLAGLPIVDAGAKFFRPARFGDEIAVESRIDAWRDKAFVVKHRVHKDGEVICEGEEVRVWGLRDPGDPEGLMAGPVPPEIVARFED